MQKQSFESSASSLSGASTSSAYSERGDYTDNGFYTSANLIDWLESGIKAVRGLNIGSPVSDYQSRIQDVARRIYDPATLGNLEQLKNKYNKEIELTKDPLRYVKQALDKDDNDPYTSYLTPSEFQKMKNSVEGKGVSAGVTFKIPTALEDKTGIKPPLVVQSFDGNDTRGHALRPGDEVLSINGKSMKGKSWSEALSVLDGQELSKISILIKRDGAVKSVSVRLTSEQSPNVTTDMVDGQFAHIRVKSLLNDYTAAEILKAVSDHPKAHGYILDLRHNVGGQLSEALSSASVFIGDGPLLKVKSRVPSDPSKPVYKVDAYSVGGGNLRNSVNGHKSETFAHGFPDEVDKPYVVLVDQGTASASEILVGALKDSDGAYVIGTQTYGKGIGQYTIPDATGDGATKITSFRYTTPSGVWPGDGQKTRTGIKPSQLVKNPSPADFNTSRDGQIKAAAAYLRKKVAEDGASETIYY